MRKDTQLVGTAQGIRVIEKGKVPVAVNTFHYDAQHSELVGSIKQQGDMIQKLKKDCFSTPGRKTPDQFQKRNGILKTSIMP
jgi:hypothetical protein